MNDSQRNMTVGIKEYYGMVERLNKQRDALAEIRRIATEMRNGPLDKNVQRYATMLFAHVKEDM